MKTVVEKDRIGTVRVNYSDMNPVERLHFCNTGDCDEKYIIKEATKNISTATEAPFTDDQIEVIRKASPATNIPRENFTRGLFQ